MDKSQKIIVAVAALTAFITSFTGSALNLAIPDISDQFAVSASRSGWIITVYTLTVAVLSLPAGLTADKKGRKMILNIGLIAFTSSSVTAGLAPSFLLLLISRGIQGLGAAMIFSTNTAILARAFGPGSRGRVLGYALASTYVGLSAGPFFGGIINHNFGWRYIFAVTALISAAALLLSIKGIPSRSGLPDPSLGPAARRPGESAPTSASARRPGESAPASAPARHPGESAPTSASARRPGESAPAPAPARRHLRGTAILTKAYICSNLAAMLNYGATFTVSYMISLYLQTVMDRTSQTAGMILLVQPVIISILSPWAGRLSDSISPFRLAAAGMSACSVSAAAGLLLTASSLIGKEASSLWVIILILALSGSGSAFFSSPNTNAVMSCLDKKYYSIASSTLSAMRALGNTLGMLVITAAASFFIAGKELRQAEPQAVISTAAITFIIAAAACAAGVALSLIKNTKTGEPG